MSEPLLSRAERLQTCVQHLRELASELRDGPELHDALRTAARERRAGAYSRLVLAALQAELPIPAELLIEGAALLPDMRALATATVRATGDFPAAMVAAVQDGRLGDWDAYALYFAAWWAVRNEGSLDAVLREARVMSRRPLTEEPKKVVNALARLTDDHHLKVVLRNEGHSLPDDTAKALVRDLETWFSAPPLMDLPAKPEAQAATAEALAAPKLGPNDRCHCGSGKKYKKCHRIADQQALKDIATGAAPARKAPVTAAELDNLRAWELCELTVERVPEALQTRWIELLLLGREYERAVTMLEALGTEGREKLVADGLRWSTVAGKREVVARYAELSDEIPTVSRLLLAEDDGERLRIAEEAARAGHDDGAQLSLDLADVGLNGLALHVGRGALPLAQARDASIVLEVLLQNRDRLGLDPTDPIEREVLPWMNAGRPLVDPGDKAELEKRAGRISALEKELGRVRGELALTRDALEEAKAAPEETEEVEVSEAEVDPRVVRELRAKAARFKDELTARNAERAELRAEVDRLRTELSELAPDTPEEVTEAEEEHDLGIQPWRMLVFPDGFDEILAKLPEAMARQALDVAGRLAAGRPDAFRGAKPLRGRRWLWRQKVGRSYRMFFKLGEGRLEIIDLVHRQDLEKRIRDLT